MIARRLFAAIDIGDDARRAMGREQQRLATAFLSRGSPLKWIQPDQIHLTLVFVGGVGPDLSAAVTAAMGEPIEGWRPFEMGFGGLGVFPPRGAPRVLWLGLATGARAVVDLQQVVAARLARLGIAGEGRPFHPHLTLARWRVSRPADRRRVALAEPGAPVAMTRVEAVTLYESRLSSSGPTYTALARSLLT